MVNKHPDNAHLTFLDLDNVEEFFCVVRSWWSGASIDAACWWRDSVNAATVHHRLILSGESWEPIEPRVVKDKRSSDAVLADLLDAFDSAKLKSQYESAVMSHCDFWYGAKRRTQAKARWVFVRGGIFANDLADEDLINKVLHYCPQLEVNES